MSATVDKSSATAVRPFEVGFSDAELTDLRRRVRATRCPERETASDDSQGRRPAVGIGRPQTDWL